MLKVNITFLPGYMSVHHVFAGAHRGQKRVLNTLKLELQTIVLSTTPYPIPACLGGGQMTSCFSPPTVIQLRL